jgi:Tol biopolymer transport system component
VALALLAIASIAGASIALQGSTSRASVDSAGNQANGSSDAPVISANGRYVAFSSFASNLVPDDTNGTYDVFVHDRETSETSRVSVASDGSEADDSSQTGGLIHVRMSADARFVAFASLATNLTTEGIPGVFVRDRQEGITTFVSFNPRGSPIEGSVSVCDISGDGNFVTYRAGTRLFLRDLFSGTSSLVASGAGCGFLSGDGRFITYVDEGGQVVLLDRQSGTSETASVDAEGAPGNAASDWPSISADGRYVAFETLASNLNPDDDNGVPDVYLRDRASGTMTAVSQKGGRPAGGSLPTVSRDGGHVLFKQGAALGSLLVYTTETASLEKISVNSGGEDANASVPEIIPAPQSLSADGRFVVFETTASNLVEGDTNEASDIFVRDRLSAGPATAAPTEEIGGGEPNGLLYIGAGVAVIGLVVGVAFLLWRRRRSA